MRVLSPGHGRAVASASGPELVVADDHLPFMKYRFDVDGLRAVSVLAVLAFHISPRDLRGGFAGVDAFFVISGFLITKLVWDAQRQGKFTFGGFYARRVRRLMPAALFTIAGVLGWTFLGSSLSVEEVATSARWAAVSAANLHFYSLSGYFDTEAISKPLLHMWSLGVEEQFYLLWPLSLWSLWGLSRILGTGRRRTVLAILCAVGLASFGWSLSTISVDREAAFFLPHFRIWEFALGGTLAFVPSPPRSNTFREATWLLGAALLLGSFVLLRETNPFPGLYALPPAWGTALVIWSENPKVFGRTLANPAAAYLGKISYSVYLVHWPLVVFYSDYVFDKFTRVEKVGLMLLSLLLGALLHRFVEEPFRRQSPWAKRVVFGKPVLASTAFIGCLVLVSLGLRSPPHVANSDASRWLDRLKVASANLDEKTSRGKCYAVGKQTFSAARCLSVNPTRRNVLVIGDSIAAAFFSGMVDYLGERGHVALAASPSCRPVPEASTPTEACRTRNRAVFREADLSSFDLVLLAGAFKEEARIVALPQAVGLLRERGARRVAILGAPVEYRRAVPSVLSRYQDEARSQIETHLNRLMLPESLKGNATLHRLAKKNDLEYYSTIDLACTDASHPRRCKHWLDEADLPIVRDNCHPSPATARWILGMHDAQGLFRGI